MAIDEVGPSGSAIVVVDGDTVKFGSETVRILNIDAPESFRSRCDDELVAGLRAKERLAHLVRVPRLEIVRNGQHCYRRTLVTLVLPGGRDVGTILIREGLALPWKDGRRAKAAWVKVWCRGR